MLQVERAAIEHDARVEALTIVEQEVELVSMYLQNLGVMAALILGFSVGFYSPDFYIDGDEGEVPTLVGFFFVTASCSISFLFVTIIAVMLVCSWGPNMAFRATEANAVRKAAEQMRQDRILINSSFALGIATFITTLCLSLCTKNIRTGYLVASIIAIVAGLLAVTWFAHHAHGRYRHLPTPTTIKGDTFLAIAREQQHLQRDYGTASPTPNREHAVRAP